VKLSKQYQRADWAERPLSEGMLNYAAHDTLHLEGLAGLLRERLEEAGRMSWAEEEFRELEKIRWSPPDPEEDPIVRVKGARDLTPREAERLRVTLEWRDGIARARDRALFRVVGDPVLLEIARQGPRSVDALAGMPGMHGGLARGEGGALLEALRRVDALPEADLRPYPRMPRGNGRGRPLPEVDARFMALKDVRTRHAEALGIDRGTLIPNHVLQTLADSPPASREALLATPSLRSWQAELLGDDLLETLRKVG
jgi:ribonuclease D